ncbi:hypothetical protein LL14B4_01250 [Lactococcus lactis subsp. lactis]|uniref:LXG domain-containing protein n=1 Tax=Lactococcus lactis subsp. lactis TaxID=1360 RepID=A0A336UYR8_LACLL|nr:hypothetical protein [Lactococcus lactis]AWN64887.1 hypothetical protein LL14B4_01250 [Lactococcus lactis subsp. lactis]
MGLKYTKADGESLVSALTTNVSSAEEIINDLQEGVNHLTSQLDNPSSGLSGKAYHAANTLFKQIVVPTLSELKSATTTIQSELSTYSSAIKAFDRYPDAVYDKDEFERLLNIKRQQKALTENHINIFMQALSTALSKTATENLIFEGKGLESVVNHYENEIRELEEKKQILEEVESQTSSLFEHSLQDFKQALQGAKALKQGSFDSKGNFTFNKNQDMSWYKKLTGKDVSDSLISKKDDEITLKDLMEGNVSKENQETLEQLKSIAKATGMKIADVWNMFYKYGKSEYDKTKISKDISENDRIVVYNVSYGPKGNPTNGLIVVVNETTKQIISQSGGNPLESFDDSESDVLSYFPKEFEPDGSIPRPAPAERAASVGGSISKAAGIYNTKSNYKVVMNGKEYIEQKKAQEERRKLEEKIRQQQTINPNRQGSSAEDFGG